MIPIPGAVAAPSLASTPLGSLDSAASNPAGFLQPRVVGAEYLRGLPDNYQDEAYMRLALLAQLEQQGLLPMGTIQKLEAMALDQGYGAPSWYYSDFHPVCDLNGDGIDDIIANEISIFWQPFTHVRAISGRDGTDLWYHDNEMYYAIQPARPGLPNPKYPLVAENTVYSDDFTGDGVCDVITFGFARPQIFLNLGLIAIYDVNLYGVDGSSGGRVWHYTYQSTLTVIPIPVDGGFILRLDGFPTGFQYNPSPTGPKFFFKTTDIQIERINSIGYEEWAVTEHIQLRDAANGEHLIYERNLTSRCPVFTWLNQPVNFGGDPEPEVFLDRINFCNDAVQFLALRGELEGIDASNQIYWILNINNQTGQTGTIPQAEDGQESFVWHQPQLLRDITGDGIPDPVGLYLTREQARATTVNGAFNVHIVPWPPRDGPCPGHHRRAQCPPKRRPIPSQGSSPGRTRHPQRGDALELPGEVRPRLVRLL
jgi:hypothetical protein